MALNNTIATWTLAGVVAAGVGYSGTRPNEPVDRVQPGEIVSMRTRPITSCKSGWRIILFLMAFDAAGIALAIFLNWR